MIPVVLGGANYSAIAPPHSFINAADFPKLVLLFILCTLSQNTRKKYYYKSTFFIILGENHLLT